MSKLFNSNDLVFTENKLNKTINLNSGSDGVKSIAFYSASISSSNQISESYHNVINNLFYKIQDFGGNGSFEGKGVLYPYSEHIVNPQYKNKFYDKGVLYSISASNFGESIKPGTFVLTDTSNSESIVIKDDGYGNLYPSGSNLVLSQSGDTSISSSDNYVGNIFYEHGLAVVTETGSYKTGNSYLNLGSTYDVQFDSTLTVYSYEYNCHMAENEYNQTSNKTILNTTSSNTSFNLHYVKTTNSNNFIPYAMYDSQSYYMNYINNVGTSELSDPTIAHQIFDNDRYYVVSGSITNLNDNIISSKLRNSTYRTYITKIGLYNDNDEMLMIAHLSTPIQKIIEHPLTIKVQIDF